MMEQPPRPTPQPQPEERASHPPSWMARPPAHVVMQQQRQVQVQMQMQQQQMQQMQQQQMQQMQQQQLLSLQLQNMQLQNSLEAKRAARARLAAAQRHEMESTHPDSREQLLQQVALQSVQLQTLMLRQIEGRGEGLQPTASAAAVADGMGGLGAVASTLDRVGGPRAAMPEGAPESSPRTAGRAGSQRQHGDGATGESAVGAHGDGVLGMPPTQGMHQLKPDELDLDLLMPDDEDAELDTAGVDLLAELGIEGLHDQVSELRGIRRLRRSVWAVLFVGRMWEVLSRRAGMSADDMAALIGVQTQVCKAWARHLIGPHLRSLVQSEAEGMSLEVKAVPAGGFAAVQQAGSEAAQKAGKFWHENTEAARRQQHSADELALMRLAIRSRCGTPCHAQLARDAPLFWGPLRPQQFTSVHVATTDVPRRHHPPQPAARRSLPWVLRPHQRRRPPQANPQAAAALHGAAANGRDALPPRRAHRE
jgi:hypothetical protein